MAEFSVVICGGGVAAVEGLLRLRRLAGERVSLTLICDQEDFRMRPLAVTATPDGGSVRRFALADVAADAGAVFLRDRVDKVQTHGRSLQTAEGRSVSYDALLLAIGGRESAPFPHAVVFSSREAAHQLADIHARIDTGELTSIAFVRPDGPVWPVPLYELALLTSAYAHRRGRRLQVYLVTPEVRPLKVFGVGAGAAIEREIARAGIELHTGIELRAGGAAAVREPGVVSIGRSDLHAELIVTLPRITGPNLRGIPAGPSWFIPIDDYCEVEDSGGRVFAAGDATDFPVKHGGLAAAQADTAAAAIAHLAGAGPSPEPFRPVIHATVLTGEAPLYLSAYVTRGIGWRSEVHEEPPWPTGEKVVAEELSAYLAARAD